MASSPSSSRRYPSDLTDKQWTLLEPLLPAPNTAGRYEKHPRREVVNAIFYVVRTGCSWRQLPLDFPPKVSRSSDGQYRARPTSGGALRCTGKGRKERRTPLTRPAARVVRDWLAERRGEPEPFQRAGAAIAVWADGG